MSLEFVSTMSLEYFVNYVLDWFIPISPPKESLLTFQIYFKSMGKFCD